MQLEGLNDYQKQIADLLWNTQTSKEVDRVIETLGVDAIIVYNMMVAEAMDSYDGIDIAESYLEKFRL